MQYFHMQLREYQTDFINNIRYGLRNDTAVLGCAPTGSGKTVTIAYMLKQSSDRGHTSLFIVHRSELVEQSLKTFKEFGIPCGVIAAGYPPSEAPVQVAMIQTLARRTSALDNFNPKLIVFDECHHVASSSWSKLFDRFPDSFKVGLTATPERLDGKGLGLYFKQIILGPEVSWLIQNKFLSDYVYYAPNKLDLTGVKKSMGDYNKADIAELLAGSTITGDCIKHYKKLCDGKRAVVFAPNVNYSKMISAHFIAAGVSSAHIDAKTPRYERARLIEEFREGRIKVLCNVDLFGEGFDLPAMEAVILLRPTASLSLHLQQVGRVLRPAEGKDKAIILDHVGNYERHGLPDDKREWSLDGRKARKAIENEGPNIRICEGCFAAIPSTCSKCNFCSHVGVPTPTVVKSVEGELSEVDKKALQQKKNQERGRAKTREELIELGKQRGYPNPAGWAYFVLNSRKNKWG
jgi:superfamily II DNA or RNA helicase